MLERASRWGLVYVLLLLGLAQRLEAAGWPLWAQATVVMPLLLPVAPVTLAAWALEPRGRTP